MSERPQNKYLKPFKPKGEQPMAGRLFVRVTRDIEQAVKALPNSPEWLRRVITQAARTELMGESSVVNTDAPGEPDRAELVELVDTALAMTKAKDIKPLLEKIRERLTK